MLPFNLPEVHSLKAKWVSLHYYPTLGSSDCFTVAVAAMADDGKSHVAAANGLERLRCFYDQDAAEHIKFLQMAISAFRAEIELLSDLTLEKFQLGSSFKFGPVRRGSGHSAVEIAEAWLSKTSIIHEKGSIATDGIAAVSTAVEQAKKEKEPKILPTIRNEVQVMDPRLVENFNTEFHPKGRILPVRLGYSGENLVASFDRVPPHSIDKSLERIRSKLWLLAEHRDQTRHERTRPHEMIVVPTERLALIANSRELTSIQDACSDIEKEADHREIRFRRFDSSHLAAQHIFSMERIRVPLRSS